MDFKALMAELKKGVYRPVYFLQGEEPFYIDLIDEFIAENALTEADRGFNQSIIYGKDTDAATIVAEARRYPMMADRQVVIVREAQNIKNLTPASKADDGEADDPVGDDKKGPFLAYCENPTPTTVLVICHKYKKLDTRYKAGKAIKAAVEKNGAFITFDKVRDYQLPDWILEHGKSLGFGLDQRTAMLLADHLGNDLSRINNEFIKLRIHLPNGGQITPDLVEKHIGISKDYNVFELTDALARRDVTKSNKIMIYFGKNQKEHPMPMVLAMLFSFFFKVLLLQNLQKRGVAASEIPKRAGINPYVIKSYEAASKLYTTRKLQLVMKHLRQADAHFKGIDNPSSDPADLMKELVFKLVN